MSGNRYLLDTNAIIALLQGDSNLIKLHSKRKFGKIGNSRSPIQQDYRFNDR